MADERVLRGRWSLPSDDTGEGVPGVLTLSDNRFVLELEGTLLTDRAMREKVTRHRNPLPVARILGLVRREDGRGREMVTLERCQLRGTEYSDLFVTRWAESYWPNSVCIGAWFEGALPLTFDNAYVRMTSLHAWTALTGFERRWMGDVEPNRTMALKYKRPRNRRARLDDGTVLTLAFPMRRTAQGLYEREVALTQDTRFELEYPEARSLEDVQADVYTLRNFVSLGASRSVKVTSLVGYQRPQPGDDPPIGRQVEILYSHTGDTDVPDAPHHHSMTFLLSDIDRRFQRHIRNWFRLRDELALVLDLYFSTLHVSSGFMQTRFMNYVQAIEGYHRRRLARLLYPDDEFQLHRDAILAGAPVNLRPLARKALAQHVNEVSLAERVADVLVVLEDASSSVLTSGQRTCKRFAMRVAEIRNIYAHVLDKPEPKPGELVTLTYQVKTLVEALLLREVGFNPIQIDGMLKQSGKYELIEIMRAYERGRSAS